MIERPTSRSDTMPNSAAAESLTDRISCVSMSESHVGTGCDRKARSASAAAAWARALFVCNSASRASSTPMRATSARDSSAAPRACVSRLAQLLLARFEVLHPALQLPDPRGVGRRDVDALARLPFGMLARDAFGDLELLLGRLEVPELAFEIDQPATILLAPIQQFRYQRGHPQRTRARRLLVDGIGEILELGTAWQESVGADLRRKRFVLGALDAERQQQHRQVLQQWVFLDAAAEREPVEFGQQHVAHDDVGRVAARSLERLDTGTGLEHAVTTGMQQRFERREILVAFVGQQDGFHSRASTPARREPRLGRSVRRLNSPCSIGAKYAPTSTMHQSGARLREIRHSSPGTPAAHARAWDAGLLGTQLGREFGQVPAQRLDRAVHEVLVDFVHDPRTGRPRQLLAHQAEERRPRDHDQFLELVLEARCVETPRDAPREPHRFELPRVVLAGNRVPRPADALVAAAGPVAHEVAVVQVRGGIGDVRDFARRPLQGRQIVENSFRLVGDDDPDSAHVALPLSGAWVYRAPLAGGAQCGKEAIRG